MVGLVAGQNASVAGAIVGNRRAIVLPDDIRVKVHQTFAGDIWRDRTHAVGGVAGGTGKTILRDVVAVSGEAGVGHDVAQTMALGAHPIGPGKAEVGIRKQVRDHCSGRRRLAELVVVLKNV